MYNLLLYALWSAGPDDDVGDAVTADAVLLLELCGVQTQRGEAQPVQTRPAAQQGAVTSDSRAPFPVTDNFILTRSSL